jgi:hypothetical protein
MRRFRHSGPSLWSFVWDGVPEIVLDLGLFARFDDVFAGAKRTMRGPMQRHRALHRDDARVGCARIKPIMYGFDDFDTDPGLRQILNVPGTAARNAGMSDFDIWHKSSRRSPAFVNRQTTIKRRLKRAGSRFSAIQNALATAVLPLAAGPQTPCRQDRQAPRRVEGARLQRIVQTPGPLIACARHIAHANALSRPLDSRSGHTHGSGFPYRTRTRHHRGTLHAAHR